MITDRELLEAAAKAAGMTVDKVNQSSRDACGAGDVGLWISRNSTCWNPLTDDGDALRLAMACGLEVREREARWWPSEAAPGEYIRDDSADPYAATRRAIVRAAAAIAK